MDDPTIEVGSTGKPIPGVEIKIVSPDPGSGIGEILGRGLNIMKGYYKNPQATREMIDEQGWLKTETWDISTGTATCTSAAGPRT